MRVKDWEKLVSPFFEFLAEYGFSRAPKLDDSNAWVTTVVYASARHAVCVTHSVEFGRAEIQLERLDAGELPKTMIFFEDAAPFNSTLLDNVVEARAPQRIAETELAGLSKAALQKQLAKWSEILRSEASDFLAGEDTVFDDAKAVIHDRVAQHPQEIVVWLPEDADDGREADALRDARASAPSNVDVVVRRYRR